jgi:NAD(P)-dependent dehydrogenase (short-subunit alcohol dehydrogenase family)
MSELKARVEAQRQGTSVEEIWNRRVGEYAAGRLPTIEEVADTIRFLAGPRAGGISGETITVAVGGP